MMMMMVVINQLIMLKAIYLAFIDTQIAIKDDDDTIHRPIVELRRTDQPTEWTAGRDSRDDCN